MSFKCKECGKVIMSFKTDTCPQCIAKAQVAEAKFNREWAERNERIRRDAYRADDERRRRLQEEAAQVRQQAERDAMASMLLINQTSVSSSYSYSDPAPVFKGGGGDMGGGGASGQWDAPVYQPTRCDDTPSYASREEQSYTCRDDTPSYTPSSSGSDYSSSSSDSSSSPSSD